MLFGQLQVEGIGEDFVPDIANIDLVDEAISVTDGEAFEAARELLRREGLLGGSSSGTLLAAALTWCRRQSTPKTVVTFVCDHGSKYLGRMYNDFWMRDQGFLQGDSCQNLRDLIARRHDEREDWTLNPDLPIMQAVKMMRLYDVSQMAVLDENDHLAGILDESDVLLAITRDAEAFDRPVRDFMTRRLETISADQKIDDLLPIFRADHVAIVMDGDQYLGLITRIDLISYLRKQMST